MPAVPAEIQALLQPGETVCAAATDTRVDFAYAPAHLPFHRARTPDYTTSLFLTPARLMVCQLRYCVYSTPAIHGLHEQFFVLNGTEKRSYPYQAFVYLPGGLILVVETPTQDMAARAQELSQFLNLAFAQLGGRRGDDEGLAAREAERRRRAD